MVTLYSCLSVDEDVEDPVKAQNKKYKSDIASHQEQLQALKDQDPEFYEYLQQTDQELLDFGQDGDEEEEEEEEEAMQEASDEEQVRLPVDMLLGNPSAIVQGVAQPW